MDCEPPAKRKASVQIYTPPDYWVNVYQKANGAQIVGQEHRTRESARIKDWIFGDFMACRIHVKPKAVQPSSRTSKIPALSGVAQR